LKKIKILLVQFIKFLFVSGTGWIIDFGIYSVLTEVFKFQIIYSNILSSIPAISFVFIISTKKIFKKSDRGFSIKQKYLIYCIYQIFLVFFISLLGQFLYEIFIKNEVNFNLLKVVIKIMITPITMIMNFFVIKYLVEKI
jgi:hypothetical protein